MTPEQQFWWNWSVNLVGVVASLLVVAVALFGERFWKWKFPPKLNVKLLEQYGEKTVAVGKQPNGLPVHHNDVRFFHLQVWNERRRWSPGGWPPLNPVVSRQDQATNSRRAAGFFLAMVRRRSAALCGRRSPCSQLLTHATLVPR
jgi:hypothetical protein